MQGYSVQFDAATKKKLRNHLTRMRELVDKAEVEQDKKEALFKKINALQEEVDRDRTRLDALADLSVTAAGILDTALEPSNKLIANIARVFYGAQPGEQKSCLLLLSASASNRPGISPSRSVHSMTKSHFSERP